PCVRQACGSSRRMAAPDAPWMIPRSRPDWPGRPPGCSGTRHGDYHPDSSRWRTNPSRCPSTAGPRASTWPPRPRCASTRPRGPYECISEAEKGWGKERWGTEMVRKQQIDGLAYLSYNIENSRLRTVTKLVFALESDHNPSPKP